MQIYSLNYFLAHKMLMRGILGLIFGIHTCVFVLPYSTIVNHKKIVYSIFNLKNFVFFNENFQTAFQNHN